VIYFKIAQVFNAHGTLVYCAMPLHVIIKYFVIRR